MKSRYLMAGGLLLVALFVVPLLVAQPALAQDDGNVTEIFRPSSATAQSIEGYWTDARMRNALPYPMPSPQGPGAARVASSSVPNQADGPLLLSPPGLPGGEVAVPSNALSAEELAVLQQGAADDTVQPEAGQYEADGVTPFPFTMFQIKRSDRWRYPYDAANGRLFFTAAAGYDSSCSGSSIGGRAVLTAGHCVSDGNGNFHSNWVFRPAYRDFGYKIVSDKSWTWSAAAVRNEWHLAGQYCRDFAVIVTVDKAGQKLSQYVGNLGLIANADATKMSWTQFGYPAERSRTTPEYFFDGTVGYENYAAFGQWTAQWWDPSDPTNDCSPLPYCIGSYMTGGASGGALVFLWDPGFGIYPGPAGRLYANGVNSTYFQSGRVAGGMCSPYFDTTTFNFIETYKTW